MQTFEKTIINILKNKDKNTHKFYFVGIGGISMYAIASRLLKLGQEVIGSDAKRTKNTKTLEKLGATIHYKHDQKNVFGADFVIYSFAVRDNVEVKKAKELNLPVLSRAKMLGLMLKCYKISICVSGAHGKTTTTALIYHVLKTAGLNPDLHLGGFLAKEDVSFVHNNSKIIVCEACEYQDAFLELKPNISVVLNVAPEHLDYFKIYNNVQKSFARFSGRGDVLICDSEHKYLKNSKKSVYFGKNGDYIAKNIKMLLDGTYRFDCYKYKKYYGRFHINLVGIHNINNALAAISVANEFGVNKKIIQKALNSFGGVKRRFEIISKKPFIVHDYAHHPDEIESVLNVIKTIDKNYNDNQENICKLLVVFQPHTYSRTKLLMNRFVEALKDYETAIYKTFSAREKYDKMGSAKTLSNNLGKNSKYFGKKNELKDYIKQKILEGYSVVILGAGDIDEICNKLNINQ